MKKIIISLSILLACQLFTGCFVSTSRMVMQGNIQQIQNAVKTVGKELDIEVMEGPYEGAIYGSMGGYFPEYKPFAHADLYLKKPCENVFNDTGFNCVMTVHEGTGFDSSVECTLGSEAADATAWSQVMLELTSQELQFQKGLLTPAQNTLKTKSTFTYLNLVSPVISTEYLFHGNPLITTKRKNLLRFQNCFGDVFMIAAIVSSFYVEENQRNTTLASGISIGLMWRLFSFLNLTDLNDYNQLAKSKYHIDRLRDK